MLSMSDRDLWYLVVARSWCVDSEWMNRGCIIQSVWCDGSCKGLGVRIMLCLVSGVLWTCSKDQWYQLGHHLTLCRSSIRYKHWSREVRCCCCRLSYRSCISLYFLSRNRYHTFFKLLLLIWPISLITVEVKDVLPCWANVLSLMWQDCCFFFTYVWLVHNLILFYPLPLYLPLPKMAG